MTTYDVVIVGGGPAGLSAALMLGRCRRRVLVCDAGEPRNGASKHLHGYLTRDGVDPWELRRLGREDLRQYGSVEVRDVRVVDAWCEASRFHAMLETGERIQSRKLLIATGVTDRVPDLPGVQELYGRSVFHCPYCDAWELSDAPLAIYGRGEKGAGLAIELTAWSRDLILLTDGPSDIDAKHADRLRRNGIGVREDRIARLEGQDGVLERIVFETGESVTRRAMFFTTGQLQQSNLATKLGCVLNEKGTVSTGKHESTHLPGLYVAGDASRAIQWVVVAAAEGAEAAFSINQALVKEDLQ